MSGCFFETRCILAYDYPELQRNIDGYMFYGPQCSSAVSSRLNTSGTCTRLNGRLLAQNQARQDFSDRVKLCSVDEGVGADVEKHLDEEERGVYS